MLVYSRRIVTVSKEFPLSAKLIGWQLDGTFVSSYWRIHLFQTLDAFWISSVSKIMFTIHPLEIAEFWDIGSPFLVFCTAKTASKLWKNHGSVHEGFPSPPNDWRISSAKELHIFRAILAADDWRVLWPLRKETSRTCLILCRENMAYHNSSGRLLKICRTNIVCSSMILDDIKEHAWKH